jgi:ADP-heptose:LPS heptosyltransferase
LRGPEPSSLSGRLRSYDAAIAYTGNEELVEALRRLIPDVRALPPSTLTPDVPAHRALAEPARDLVGGPIVEPPPLRPRLEDDATAEPWLRRLPEAFLAIHPGSGSPGKNWPAARFVALAERLATGRRFLVIEGPADECSVAPLRLERAVIARDLPLRALGALLRHAGLFVGNDSGVSHLAAAFGAPTLVLFGPTNPAVWSPSGPLVWTLRERAETLDALEVATVERAAREALRSGA